MRILSGKGRIFDIIGAVTFRSATRLAMLDLILRQIVDTGLDYSSCFFIDSDGEEVAHGHYFLEIGVASSVYPSSYTQSSQVAVAYGGDFHADKTRRKVSDGQQRTFLFMP